MMIQFICIFFPSVLGLLLYLKLKNKKVDILSSGLHYIGNVLFTTLGTMLVSYSCFHVTSDVEYLLSVSIPFAIKYIVVAVIVSLLCALIYAVIEKNLGLKLVVKKNEKKK